MSFTVRKFSFEDDEDGILPSAPKPQSANPIDKITTPEIPVTRANREAVEFIIEDLKPTEQQTVENSPQIPGIDTSEKPLGFGIGRALEYARKNGLIQRTDDIIEYRDEFGNILKGKEAFKFQSRVFSGFKAGIGRVKRRK